MNHPLNVTKITNPPTSVNEKTALQGVLPTVSQPRSNSKKRTIQNRSPCLLPAPIPSSPTHDDVPYSLGMDKQKFRPTRRSGFSGAKAYLVYVEVLKKRYNNVGRNFCDAIKDTVPSRLVKQADIFPPPMPEHCCLSVVTCQSL